MLLSMMACTNQKPGTNNPGGTTTPGTTTPGTTPGTPGTTETPGNTNVGEEQTLTGTAKGYGGDVEVTVKVKDNKIVSVEAKGDKETAGVGSKAIDELPKKIVDADSTNVDNVSGATVTSKAIKDAVDQALKGKK